MNVSRRPKPEVRQIELATSGDSRAAAGLLQLEHFIYGEESVQEADPLLSQNTKIPGRENPHTGLGLAVDPSSVVAIPPGPPNC